MGALLSRLLNLFSFLLSLPTDEVTSFILLGIDGALALVAAGVICARLDFSKKGIAYVIFAILGFFALWLIEYAVLYAAQNIRDIWPLLIIGLVVVGLVIALIVYLRHNKQGQVR